MIFSKNIMFELLPFLFRNDKKAMLLALMPVKKIIIFIILTLTMCCILIASPHNANAQCQIDAYYCTGRCWICSSEAECRVWSGGNDPAIYFSPSESPFAGLVRNCWFGSSQGPCPAGDPCCGSDDPCCGVQGECCITSGNGGGN